MSKYVYIYILFIFYLKFKIEIIFLILSSDIKLLIENLWNKNECPQIILVGHSMGGALAVHIACRKLIENLIALVVIDVVEGKLL